MKQPAIIAGPCVGEMYWELARFATHVIWKMRTKYRKSKVSLVVCTRPDRYDLYGRYALEFTPLVLDEGDFQADCFDLIGLGNKDFDVLVKKVRSHFEFKYDIVDHLYPDISNRKIARYRSQFPRNRRVFDKFKPRQGNLTLIKDHIPSDKPWIAIAPRFRKGFRRNWPYWQEFYDMIDNSGLTKHYHFILCGKVPDHIEDKKKRFIDINYLDLNKDSSLSGLTIEIVKRSILTVGSQSNIPNLSLLQHVPALEWGHQKFLHTKSYNVFKTPVTFLDDPKYKVHPDVVFNKMRGLLKDLRNKKG